MVKSVTSPEGRLSFGITMNSMWFVARLKAAKPHLEFSICEATSNPVMHSKLDLVALLHRHGWGPSTQAPVQWLPDQPLVYRQQNILTGSKYYFACLLMSSTLIERGARCILHTSHAKYYRAMLSLENLHNLQSLVDAANCSSTECDKLLSQAGQLLDVPENVMLAIEDGTVDSSTAEESTPVQVAAFAAQQELLSSVTLDRIGTAAAHPIVFFDNCSHSSGILRGYTKCVWGHTACFKYRQLNVAGSKENLVAFMNAWQMIGEGSAREDHSGADPPQQLVAAQFARLYPTDRPE